MLYIGYRFISVTDTKFIKAASKATHINKQWHAMYGGLSNTIIYVRYQENYGISHHHRQTMDYIVIAMGSINQRDGARADLSMDLSDGPVSGNFSSRYQVYLINKRFRLSIDVQTSWHSPREIILAYPSNFPSTEHSPVN